jgi:hypothetical protein
MLTIDRLVLRLPGELAGREKTLGRAIGTAFARYRPAQALTAEHLAATLQDISPAMNDAAIADAVVRAVTGQIDRRIDNAAGSTVRPGKGTPR